MNKIKTVAFSILFKHIEWPFHSKGFKTLDKLFVNHICYSIENIPGMSPLKIRKTLLYVFTYLL